MVVIRKRFVLSAFCVLLAAAICAGVILHGTQVNASPVIAADIGTYPFTLIIDAGHGGADGGAVSVTGVPESTINLAIAKKAELIAVFFGINTIMTRYDDEIVYSPESDTLRKMKNEDQKNRLTLINTTENAILLSIHQNTYPSGSPSGAQVLYAPTDKSLEWAADVQGLLAQSLNPNNKRAATLIQDTIYLMNHCTCPAILVECGFLSNAKEEALLRTDTYQTKIAVTLICGVLRYAGGINET